MTTLTVPVPDSAPTFAGADRCNNLETLDAEIAIIGVPYGVVYPSYTDRPPYSEGANAIRQHSGKFGRFRDHYDIDLGGTIFNDRPIRIVDCGDVDGAADDGPGNHARIEEAVRLIRSRGAVAITIGGNDSNSTPVMRGLDANSDVALVHFDAHLDYRDEVEGLRNGWSSSIRRASEMEHMGHAIQMGVRGLGSARPQDYRDAVANGNTMITAREIFDRGSREIAATLPAMDNIYVAFDADVMDLGIAPGAGAPSFGGLTYWQATALLQATAARGNIIAANFSSFVPGLDPRGLTPMLMAQLMINMIAAMARSAQFAHLPHI